jgi:chemotaxis protein CheD
MNVVVGVADCRVSNEAANVLVTYALGSCVGVAIYDPVAQVGGLLHFMLPESSPDALQSGRSPYMFADTGIPLLFREAYQKGAEKRRLRVRVAGGAQVIDDKGVFNIGQRNCLAVRKILWKAGVMVHGEETGGASARTMRLEMNSGRVYLRSPDREEEREL